MSQKTNVSLAQSQTELGDAFRLLYRNYRDLGLVQHNDHGLWLTPRHMMPTTANIIVKMNDQIVAAASLFVDSSLTLPLEEHVSLAELHQSGGLCAELSAIAINQELSEKTHITIKSALYRFALAYATQYLGITHLLSQHDDSQLATAVGNFYFRKVNIGGKKINYLDLANLDNPQLLQTAKDEFNFPERKFYELSDTPWTLENFRHFFVDKTKLLFALNEKELKALQNIYDFGAFSSLFDQRRSVIGAFRSPRFRRYAMNCNASIIINDGEPIHLQIQDVSLKGMRAHCEERLSLGVSYVLRVSVGVSEQADVIAKLVWRSEKDNALGFELANGDETWKRLIAHLETKNIAAA